MYVLLFPRVKLCFLTTPESIISVSVNKLKVDISILPVQDG